MAIFRDPHGRGGATDIQAIAGYVHDALQRVRHPARLHFTVERDQSLNRAPLEHAFIVTLELPPEGFPSKRGTWRRTYVALDEADWRSADLDSLRERLRAALVLLGETGTERTTGWYRRRSGTYVWAASLRPQVEPTLRSER